MEASQTRSRRAQSAQKTGVLPLSEFNRIKASVAGIQPDTGFYGSGGMSVMGTATGSSNVYGSGKNKTGQSSLLKPISSVEEDRRKLKDISDQRTQNWSNTISALRKKKETDKYLKFEKEELERRKIDLEEAQFQAGVKKSTMDKAKRQIFERHDKVKTLHSKMLLSDALQEREMQMEIEMEKKRIAEEIAKEQHQNILLQCEEHDRKEEEKARILGEKRAHQQEVLKQQHEVFRDKHILKLMEDRIEGEIIKKKAQEQEFQAQQEERLRRDKIKHSQAETFKSNIILQDIRRKEKERELEEEKLIEKYHQTKEATEKRRKEDAERKFQEKQRIRQQMIDKAVTELQKKVDKENERLSKDIEEARMKAENVEKEKREKIAKLKSTIDHHRELYMRDKNIRKEKDVQEDKNFQAFWKDKNKTIEENLKEEKHNRYGMNKKLANFQKQQADEKAREREDDFMREMNEAEMVKQAIENDDKMVNTYAKRCLEEWQHQGKNVTPILLELKKQRMQNLENL